MTPNRSRIVALLAAVMLVTAVAVPAVAAEESTLSVSVEQDHETGEAIVAVSDNGTAVENATVSVNASGNYSANETYTTGVNGTVHLPAPDERVTVELTAAHDGDNVTESVELVPLEASLDVSSEQAAGEPATVTVTQYGDAVTNATVSVIADGNDSYAGTGDYQTNENGTVELPAPQSTTNVTVEAASNNLTAETGLTLEPAELDVVVSQDADDGVLIEVTEGDDYVDDGMVLVENSNYTYEGSYDVENGTVSLPAPTQNVSVSVTATVDDRTASTTVTLSVPTDDNPNNDFAESLTNFIHFIKSQGVDGPLGQEISAFVHAENPASADDDRGPPAVANGENDSDEDRRGPPAHANSNGHNGQADDVRENERGPANETDESETDADDVDSETEDDDEERMEGDDADETESDDEAEAESEEADETESEDEEETESENEEENDSDDDERRGPPEHANGPR